MPADVPSSTAITMAPTIPPQSPSKVLWGLTRGASNRRPASCPITWLKPSKAATTR